MTKCVSKGQDLCEVVWEAVKAQDMKERGKVELMCLPWLWSIMVCRSWLPPSHSSGDAAPWTPESLTATSVVSRPCLEPASWGRSETPSFGHWAGLHQHQKAAACSGEAARGWDWIARVTSVFSWLEVHVTRTCFHKDLIPSVEGATLVQFGVSWLPTAWLGELIQRGQALPGQPYPTMWFLC